jgi:hypothetical protein
MTIKRLFIYDRPVCGLEFLNRERELRSIFSALYRGASTVISGTPRSGKSSLLLKLTDSTTERHYLGDQAKQFLFVFIDLDLASSEWTPSTFWEKALTSLLASSQEKAYADLAKQTAAADYSPRSLEQLFEYLGQQGTRLVLLLDEFECLLTHPNFRSVAFFALLRHLATLTRGLAIVAATRLRVTEMNQKVWRGSRGSPLFNYMIQVPLRPFDEKTVSLLLERGGFDESDRALIRCLAGHQPFLLQVMASTLLETRAERHPRAASAFYERVAFYFDELWQSLDNRTRTAIVILSLLELSQAVDDEKLTYQALEQDHIFVSEWRRLAELGLAKQVPAWSRQNGLMWRGERWTVNVQAFLWWVWDVVITQTRRVLTYDEWLYDKRYRLLLSEAQWESLLSVLRNANSLRKVDIRLMAEHSSSTLPGQSA